MCFTCFQWGLVFDKNVKSEELHEYIGIQDGIVPILYYLLDLLLSEGVWDREVGASGRQGEKVCCIV